MAKFIPEFQKVAAEIQTEAGVMKKTPDLDKMLDPSFVK
jgi:hypothetical protein